MNSGINVDSGLNDAKYIDKDKNKTCMARYNDINGRQIDTGTNSSFIKKVVGNCHKDRQDKV